jgi:hypothetical protein
MSFRALSSDNSFSRYIRFANMKNPPKSILNDLRVEKIPSLIYILPDINAYLKGE